MCDQVTKEWVKAIQSEWNLLQKNLPGQFMLITFCQFFISCFHQTATNSSYREFKGDTMVPTAYTIITYSILLTILFHSNLVMLAYCTYSELTILY